MRLGLREANQHFSRAIKAVREGKEVVLTDRGKPIAVIKPLKGKETPSSIVRRLEARGILRPRTKRGRMPPWKPLKIAGKPLSQTVREERDER